VVLCTCILVCVSATENVVIDTLRQKLLTTSKLLAISTLMKGNQGVSCSCEEYCTGQCFSLQCSPCDPSTFSFNGGASLCLAPGPLGSGLLCHVEANGTVTEKACCSSSGPTCWLPANECCSSGDCTTCSKFPPVVPDLFYPLPRTFNDTSNTCVGLHRKP
jgi:hypothetical protein